MCGSPISAPAVHTAHDPHLPDGSRAAAGVGCHYLASFMNRNTDSFTQMGGEGVLWAGQAPFTSEKHIFANIGDGTYFHSGSLAIQPGRRGGAQHYLQNPLQ